MRDGGEGMEQHIAPVTALFEPGPSSRHPAHAPARRGQRPTAASESAETPPVLRAVNPVEAEEDEERSRDAERGLLRKLGARALSEAEARLLLRAEGLDEARIEGIVDDCRRRGYLDDRVLAELFVRTGVERRNQGRAVLARGLAQRGLDREVIDEALAALPDDAERALEFARRKAQGMARLDREVAIRRLAGQLARRGFGSSAPSAARQAIDEAQTASHTVRFR